MLARQPLGCDLLDPSSGFYEDSKIASFHQPRNFIATFRSKNTVDSLYHDHIIIFHVVCDEFSRSNNRYISRSKTCSS